MRLPRLVSTFVGLLSTGVRTVVGILTLLFLLATPVGLTANDVTVLQVFVHGDADYLERTRVLLSAFEEDNPDIKIEMVPGPQGGSPEEKLAIMIAAGVAPDLARLWNTKQSIQNGLIQDITPYFQRLSPEAQEDMWPPIKSALSHEGHLYALPLGTAVNTFFYNPKKYSERGVPEPDDTWSWENEGIEHLKKLTHDRDGDGRPDEYAMVRAGGQSYHTYTFIHAAGAGALFSEDGRQFLGNTPITIDALEFLHDLAHVHNIMPPTGSSYTDFMREEKSTLMWGSFMVGYFEAFPDLQWDIAQIPSFRGNRATVMWPETPYAIPVGAKHPDEAWRVLEFMYSPKGQELAMELGWGIPPARASVARTAFIREFASKNIGALVQMMQHPLNQPMPHQAPAQATSALVQAFQAAIAGTKAPLQAIQEVTPTIQGVLDRVHSN